MCRRRPAIIELLLLTILRLSSQSNMATAGRHLIVGGRLANDGGGASSSSSQQPFLSSVNYLFETFSPYGLLRFYEFSDKGWNISANCLYNMYNYLEGLRRDAQWAVKLYDASGFYGGGALAAGPTAYLRLYDTQLCRALQRQHEEQAWRQPRKLYWNASVVPFPVHIIMAHYQLDVLHETEETAAYRAQPVQQLICFPQSCNSNDDLLQILEVYALPINRVVRNGSYVRHRIVADDYTVRNDICLYVLLTFLCSSLCLYAAVHFLCAYLALVNRSTPAKRANRSTAVELPLRLLGEKSPAPNLPRIVEKSQTHNLEELLHACSLRSVLYELFQTEAMPQHAVMVLATVCMIYAQLAAELNFATNNSAGSKFVFKYASYVVDVYFLLHASKLSQQFGGQQERKQCEQLNVGGQLRRLFSVLAQKLFCLVPSYTFCLFAEYLLRKHFHHNVALELPTYEYRNCHDNKLSNILYMDIFFPLRERCMPWTWFISLEVQFFVIASLILLLAEIHSTYAFIIGLTIFGTSLFASTIWESRLEGANLSLEWNLTQFYLVYDNAMQRVPSYLLGLRLGRTLRKSACVELNLYVTIMGWLFAFFFVGLSIWGYEMLASRLNLLGQSFLITMSHVLFSLLIFWLLLTSSSKNGVWLYELLSFRCCHTLERLSSISLLIAPLLIRLLIFTADSPVYASQAQILLLAIGCCLLTYLCALLLYVLLDGPLMALITEMTALKRT